MHILLLALSLLVVACGADPSSNNSTVDAAAADASLDTGPCALAGSLCACGVGAGRLPGQLVCADASLACVCDTGDAGFVDVARDVGCVPGSVRVCPCPGGNFGMQACLADGLDACRCGTPAPPPVDVMVVADVSDASDVSVDACASMTVGNCCGVACERRPNVASAACVAGRCGVGACTAGFGDCDGDATNGCETNLQTSNASCGACGAPCAAGRMCASAACVLACPAGRANCDGMDSTACEVNTQTDNVHCGACNSRCSTGRRCVSGRCV